MGFSHLATKNEGILVQQKVSKAITGDFPATMTRDQRTESDELAYTSIILHLSDQVLRKVVILLNAISKVYRDVKSAIKYGRDTLTKIVINSLRSKELEFRIDKTGKESDSLFVRYGSITRQVNGQGCTFHMTSRRPWLEDYKDLDGTKRNGIYVTRVSVVLSHTAESSSAESDATLKWYNRLAHVFQKFFGDEVVMTAMYIVNRTSTSFLDGKTPEEVWSGKLADYTVLKTFECAAYSHQSLGKLESRSQKCLFMGYPKGVKGYRL
ncbi:unnamed protein product [Fraxinus pennsylvanica]|uniref:Retroviral polymerase SH3-like domain-containing protein n=1 Tax=Fraxinus pennsylvanica TaxID=56036 RepID=A0AAD1ZML8_9LAMI|nr:unnamed protein product [Fraxinus pennsylvanica]